MNIGQILSSERGVLGLSQKGLADILGISDTFLGDIELGRRGLPEKHVAKLPEPMRSKVAAVFVEEHEAAIRRLRV